MLSPSIVSQLLKTTTLVIITMVLDVVGGVTMQINETDPLLELGDRITIASATTTTTMDEQHSIPVLDGR